MVSKKNIIKLLQYFKIKGTINRKGLYVNINTICRKIKYMSKPKP